MSQFKTNFPNKWDEREQAAFSKMYGISKAIADRGPVDPNKLVSGGYPEGTVGIPESYYVSEAIVRYFNEKYLPDFPLYTDDAFAKAAGYQACVAIPTLAAHEHLIQIAVPPEARDEFVASNLWRKVTNVAPIYAGDTLWFAIDYLSFKDLTPAEGSIYRTISIYCGCSTYNQNAELVSRMDMKWYENLRTYEGETPDIQIPFVKVNWQTRPDHYYTDDDWTAIRDILSKEHNRGSDVLYWEDVSIGDEPAWTVDGPFDDTPNPPDPWGPGYGGSRSLYREYADDETFAKMIRNPHDGIYRLQKRSMSFPEIPEGLTTAFSNGGGGAFGEWSFEASDDPTSEPPERAIFINFFGRDVALRHIFNYMGHHGKLKDLSWGIMDCKMFAAKGFDFPEDPNIPRFLDVLPDMKDVVMTHGLERDCMIIKSRVFEKCIENGDHVVKLAWWIETIDGLVFESGHATIALPTKN